MTLLEGGGGREGERKGSSPLAYTNVITLLEGERERKGRPPLAYTNVITLLEWGEREREGPL